MVNNMYYAVELYDVSGKKFDSWCYQTYEHAYEVFLHFVDLYKKQSHNHITIKIVRYDGKHRKQFDVKKVNQK